MILAYFSNDFKDCINFCAFGSKMQIVGKTQKILNFVMRFGKVLLQIEPSEITSFFYNNFFPFRVWGNFPYVPLLMLVLIWFLSWVDSYWIGLTDEAHEGRFTWASDATLAASNTKKIGGVPFSNSLFFSGQHCVNFYYGELDDFPCDNSYGMCLCEMSGTLFHLSIMTYFLLFNHMCGRETFYEVNEFDHFVLKN